MISFLSLLMAIVMAFLFPSVERVRAVPAQTTQMPPGVGGFISPNLSYVATLPLDSPGVGARVVQIGKQRRLYVTGVRGLTIYDVTKPELPMVLGHLELPNWENEDVAVSKDGSTVLISEWTGTYMHVIDASNPLAPKPVGFIPNNAGHVVSCVDDPCNWVYGSEGSIIDLRDKTKPTLLARGWAAQLGLPKNGHNVERDEAGIVWTDTRPIAALDVRDPAKPRLIATGQSPAEARTAYQHNLMRPGAAQYKQRNRDETYVPPSNGLRAGEVIYTVGEAVLYGPDNICHDNSGPFATYSVAGFERGGRDRFKLLDVFRPVNGTYMENGDPAVSGFGCSAHWFTIHPDGRTVANAWYEHGTRLLRVNPRDGKISQIGYFQPVVGAASAAYWVGDSHIYVVDYERGIDILRYNPKAGVPSQAEFDRSWLAKANTVSPQAAADRYNCNVGRLS